jgi:MotA/TolQ/ExbB proton channel family
MAVSHARLRLDFFRNLPGVFTGVGIIGTFSGLISALRVFQISQDPAVVQRSLESLLTGVWGAFLISAFAIALAIVVTVVEKVLSSALAQQLAQFAEGLDAMHPPQPASREEAAWMPRLLEALGNLASRPVVATIATQSAAAADASERRAAVVDVPTPENTFESMVPIAADVSAAAALAPAAGRMPAGMVDPLQTVELSSQMLEIAQSTRAATTALHEMAGRMPDLFAQTLQGANQSHQQSTQVMKALASRLENVAANIEFSARKTLETVASRLMQSEMNMVSRHHAVADHLGELVQRIEALCGLLQQDRADVARGSGYEDYGVGSGQPGMVVPTYNPRADRESGRGMTPRSGGQLGGAYPQPREPGMEANGYRNGGHDAPQWQDADDDLDGFAR